MCATEGGLDRFKKLVQTLLVIGDPTDLDTRSATTQTQDNDLDPVALAAARKLQDDDDGRQFISTADAVALAKQKDAAA